MSLTKQINSENIVQALLKEGLVLIKKTDLQEMITNINLSNRVDHRKKYITSKEAVAMFGITNYWLKKQRECEDSLLVCISGEHNNSAWKYQIQSIEKELNRLSA